VKNYGGPLKISNCSKDRREVLRYLLGNLMVYKIYRKMGKIYTENIMPTKLW
jgi:hypothetical protein